MELNNTTSFNTSICQELEDCSTSTEVETLRIWREICLYVRIIVSVVGLVGNVVALALFSILLRRRPLTSVVYFIGLALSNTVVMVSSLLYIEIYADVSRPVTSTYFGCGFSRFLSNGSQMASAWILVAMSVDRAIAVLLPFKVKQICTVKRGIVAVYLLFIISFSYSSHAFFTSKPVGGVCKLDPEHSDHFHPGNSVTHLVFYCAIPFVVISACNIIILTVIKTQKAKIIGRSKSVFYSKHSRMITRLLITVSIFFLIFTLPHMVHCFLHLNCIGHCKMTVEEQIFETVIPITIPVDHAANFYLYVSSCPLFRREAHQILCDSFSGCKVSLLGHQPRPHLDVNSFGLRSNPPQDFSNEQDCATANFSISSVTSASQPAKFSILQRNMEPSTDSF